MSLRGSRVLDGKLQFVYTVQIITIRYLLLDTSLYIITWVWHCQSCLWYTNLQNYCKNTRQHYDGVSWIIFPVPMPIFNLSKLNTLKSPFYLISSLQKYRHFPHLTPLRWPPSNLPHFPLKSFYYSISPHWPNIAFVLPWQRLQSYLQFHSLS